ncbi:MAG: phosphodiester glycosidase family protein [Actinomycetota bacterium]
MGRALGACFVMVATAVIAAALPTVGGLTSIDAGAAAGPGPAGPNGGGGAVVDATGGDPAASAAADVLTIEVGAGIDADGCEPPDQPASSAAPNDGDPPALVVQRLVIAVYCEVLGRLPDHGGMAYWTGELGTGLDPTGLYTALVESDEFLALGVEEPGDVLDGFGISIGTEDEEVDQAASSTTTTRPSVPDADEAEPTTTSAATTSAATVADPAPAGDGLLATTRLDNAGFLAVVDQAGLTEPDRVTSALIHGRQIGDGQRVNVAFVHLSATRGVRVSPGDRGRSTVGTWAEEIGAHVAINGNWYAPWDGPAVAGGVVYAGSDHGYTALFGFTEGGEVVLEHHREINDGVDPRIVEGVSGHPTLIHRGQPTTDFGTDPTFLNRHPRTAIGVDASGDVLILVTVDGRSRSAIGMTGAETVDLLVALGAHDAVMLDGGGSSTMWIAGRGVVNQPSGGLRAVGNQIAVFGD